MITITALSIVEFRGIRRLSLEMNGQNFVVCGPNGTGKSGVIDAIEFALTGSITRLTGRGTKAITLREHAPHVDSRNSPDSARVILTAWSPHLQKSFTIERSVKQFRTPRLTPDEPAIRELVGTLETHPEFALSRREIIKYVMVEPGQRAKDVQELLRLGKLEALRALFVKVANSARKEASFALAALEAARQALRTALGIAELREMDILRVVNERRTLLSLAPLSAISPTYSFRDGLASGDGGRQPLINKAVALRDIAETRVLASGSLPADVVSASLDTKAAVKDILADDALLRSLMLEPFLRRGLDLVIDPHCPLCDTDWQDVASLKAHVSQKLALASTTRASLDRCRTLSRPILAFLKALHEAFSRIQSIGQQLSPKVDTAALATWSEDIRSLADTLAALSDLPKIDQILSADLRIISGEALDSVSAVEAAVTALPDQGAQDDARTYLIVADERHREATRARLAADLWKRRQTLAEKAQEVFVRVVDEALGSLYDEVESDFVNYYVALNKEDESQFSAQLQPSVGKLGFEVDFYGRGLFPPGAYHSEGHQDAMGLCLYLALMRHTLGEDFTFAVLDDVLMSIDSGHRREVCRLLREKFPNTQFLLTTHDETWRQYMITEGLVSAQSGISFRKWTVEDGPQVGITDDVWTEIQAFLDTNNVPSAAHALRRNLEYIFTEIATRLKARVEIRGDNRYELGELLPAAVGKWGDLLGKAKSAAQSWGDQKAFAALTERHAAFKQCLSQTRVEQWAINASVHYNSWAALRPEEFARVVNAFKSLVASLQCQGACKALFYAEPRMGQGQATQIRCACGETAINLNTQPKAKDEEKPRQGSLFAT